MTSNVSSQAAVLEKPAVISVGSDSSQLDSSYNAKPSLTKNINTNKDPTQETLAKEELGSLHGKESLSFESDSKIKDSVNSDNPEATENGVSHKSASSVLEKMMEVVTWGAVALNGSSILAKLLSDKEGPFKAFSEPLEKIALLSTKAQAIGFSTKILQQAFEEKDIMLALAGFGKVFQIAFAKFGNFLQLGGFQTAFDQLNPGLKPTTGLEKFSSFGHSAKEYLKAIKVVFKDILDDPVGYLKLSPQNGHVERVLVPGAMSILAGTFGGMLAGENKVAKVIAGILRHVTGGIIGGDIILGKLTNNKEMNLSGNAYIAASAIDCGANLLQDKNKEDIAHQAGTLVNFIAELFFLKGLKQHAPA
ncbi:MAG: hypothetical protein ACOYK1_07340 [Vampirovibrionia bacterium]